MRGLWAATAAMVVCLLLSGLPALAQEASDDAGLSDLPFVVTGTESCQMLESGTQGSGDGLLAGGSGVRDQHHR